jgi:hypothetical protein
MSGADPMEILRTLAQAERDDLAPAPEPEALIRDIERTSRRRRRRRRVGIVAALMALFATGGGVAWAIVHRTHAPDPTQISCHQAPTLESNQIALSADGTDPVELCRRAWTSEPTWGTPPPLVACVGDTDITDVFPGDDTTCATLGLTPLALGYTPAETAVIQFKDHATSQMLAGGCVSREDAVSIVEADFERFGLTGWTISFPYPFTADMPCAGLAIDASLKLVAIRPLPDIFGDDQGG